LIVQVIVGFLRIVSERGLAFGRLMWQVAPGSCRRAVGTVTVEADGTGGAGEAGIMTMARAEDWRGRGGYFSWRPAAGDAVPVEVFR